MSTSKAPASATRRPTQPADYAIRVRGDMHGSSEANYSVLREGFYAGLMLANAGYEDEAAAIDAATKALALSMSNGTKVNALKSLLETHKSEIERAGERFQ